MQSSKKCCCDVDMGSVGRHAQRLARRFMPVLSWVPTLTSKQIIADCTGGFIAGVMIVPTCLSWASLAGLNLSCGLSAALMASLSYGTFGSCAVLAIGPVAEITTLLISIAGVDPAKREQTFQSMGVQVGILSVLLSFIDGGKVIKTIFAKSVGDGYTCAAALLAICVQLKTMFNVTTPPATLIQDVLFQTIKALIQQFSSKCVYSFLLFMTYCLYLIYIKKTKLPLWIPHQLIVVVLSTLVTYNFKLYTEASLHLGIVGDIPAGLKKPSFPPWENMIGLGPYTLTITMISFVQMYVIAQRVMPDINPNGELFASGVTNFLCNVFGGMPVTNSFSVSSVLLEQRVNTPLTAYATATVLLITMIFLTRLGVFYYLPKQALGAIVVASVWRLVDFSGPMRLWQYSKKDAAVWVLTFVLTIFGGITVGVLGGIALSLILVVLRVARPRAVAVGFNMSTFRYGDLSKDPELLVYPNILLWRFDAPLYFVNADYFQEKLTKAIRAEVRPIDVVIVTCGKIVDIDAAALGALPTMIDFIAKSDKDRQRRILLCDIHGRLEQVLLTSEALPFYVPDEFDRLTIEQIDKTGKSPVVFKKLEDAVAFAQRCLSERYGNVDIAPYPNVSFLTDLVVAAARLQDADGGSALRAIAMHDTGGAVGDGVGGVGESARSGGGSRRDGRDADAPAGRRRGQSGSDSDAGSARGSRATLQLTDAATGPNNMNVNLLIALEKLEKLSSYSPDRELIGVIGVIRHTELTPRQKEKILFTERRLIHNAFRTDAALHASKRAPEDLQDFLRAVEDLLRSGQLHHAESWRRVMTIVRSNPPGLKIKVKAQVIITSQDGSFSSVDVHQLQQLEPHCVAEVQAARFVVKWGGVPTRSGIAQAHVLGEKLFARFYAAGDLPLRRLLAFTKQPTVFASDDSRVVSTALVVTNALTQSNPVTKEDIIFDDKLLKTLSPTAKRLLHDEYKYFEALMHIGSHAAARHYFHIPGFRQLLLIPPLDRPLLLLDEDSAGVDAGGVGLDGSAMCDAPPQHSSSPPGASHDSQTTDANSRTERTPYRGALSGEVNIGDELFGSQAAATARTDISFFHNARAVRGQGAFTGDLRHPPSQPSPQRQIPPLANSDYYTPFEVMQELERTMRTIVETDLPRNILSLPLSNHETLHELRQRYGAILEVFLGGKRRQNYSTREAVARRRRRGDVSSPSQSSLPRHHKRDNSDSDDDEDDGDSVGTRHPSSASDAHERNDNNDDGEEENALDVVGGTSDENENDDDNTSDNSSKPGEDAMMAEITSPPRQRDDDEGGRKDSLGNHTEPFDSDARQSAAAAATEKGAASGTQRAAAGKGSAGDATPLSRTQAFSSALAPKAEQASSPPSPPREPQRADPRATRTGQPSPTPPQKQPVWSTPSSQPSSLPPRLRPSTAAAGATTTHPSERAPARGDSARYDLSDISKLRNYGSYDLSYNVSLLKGLHAVTCLPELRRLIDALVRIARITECMSRVGENVLEGINSSKRFIIGSLVAGGLLERVYRDYREFAKMDERKGVRELLARAQSLHMAEKSSVEQDVKQVMNIFRRFGRKRQAGAAGKSGGSLAAAAFEPMGSSDEPAQSETAAEREHRLQFPFIALPPDGADDPAERHRQGSPRRHSSTQKGNCSVGAANAGNRVAGDEGGSSTRFYFTTYLHVEGTLQCLFESSTVEGFSRPSKEEMEESQQLYMKHLIFKVFRRRNYSFTDAEVLSAFRKLHLLFRSDVDYGRQQNELRAGLASIYHAMYYISMEVYLSLGDAEGLAMNDAHEDPLLYLESNAADGANQETGSDMWMAAEDPRQGCRRRRNSDGSGANSEDNAGSSGTGSDIDGKKDEKLQLEGTVPARRTRRSPSTPSSSLLAQRSGADRRPRALDAVAALPTITVTPPTIGLPPGAAPASATRVSVASSPSRRDPNAVLALAPSAYFGSFVDSPQLSSGRLTPGFDAAVAVAAAASPRSPSRGSAGAASGADTVAVAVSSPVSPSLEASLAGPQPPPQKRRKRHHASNNPKRAATVLTTPQAGRGTAAVQEMKNRVSSVTPMRRIHEGISLGDFLRLIREAESAIRSQEAED